MDHEEISSKTPSAGDGRSAAISSLWNRNANKTYATGSSGESIVGSDLSHPRFSLLQSGAEVGLAPCAVRNGFLHVLAAR